MRATVSLSDDDHIGAHGTHHPEHVSDGYTYRARTVVHLDLGALSLVLDVRMAARIRDALSAGIEAAETREAEVVRAAGDEPPCGHSPLHFRAGYCAKCTADAETSAP